MYGLARGTMTLIGVAAAGALLWLATQMGDWSSGGAYWASMGLLAAAGLAIALSQLLGGWTKWGTPRISGPVFLLGFLPALVVGGIVLLAGQPDGSSFQGSAEGLAGDIGLGWLIEDLMTVLPAVAFALGLVFGLTFDTAGPRVHDDDEIVEDRRHVHTAPVDTHAADEPVTAERTAVREEHVETEYHEPDREFVRTVSAGETDTTRTDDRGVEIREGGTPVAPRRSDTDDRI